MRLIRRIAQFTPVRLLKPPHRKGQCSAGGDAGGCSEKTANELTLENIRDLIIEANCCVDKKRRIYLLEKAARLEKQLIAAYRAKGLMVTAENITKTLKVLRRHQRIRSS